MPNDLTAKRNLLNSRDDVRSESQRQKLTSSGFTASIWTISGVVLVACGNIEDFLGIDDGGGGGGGGRSVHVQSSAVQGARIYFDTDGGGVGPAERTAQDALYPEGFITDATGEARGIPAEFYGKPFIADLRDAINVETGEALSGTLRSIPDANGDHTLASPITEYIESEGGDPKEVVADLINAPDADSDAVQAQIRLILDSRSYLGGNENIEALSVFLAEENSPTRDDAGAFLVGDDATQNPETLFVADADISKTIGADADAGTNIATIHAVSHGDNPVEYSIVESAGGTTIDDDSAFIVDSQGVVSVRQGAMLMASNTAIPVYVRVSNGDSAETVTISVTIAEPAVVLTAPSGTSGTIAENVDGSNAEPILTGIETSDAVDAADFTISDALGLASGVSYAGMFDIVAAGNTWNLVLIDNAELDFETIPNGVINLRVHVEPSGNAPSNILEIAVTVTDDPDDIAFSGVVRGEVTKDSGEYEVSGTITIANQPSGTAVDAADGTYGTLDFASGTWTYTLTNTDATVQRLLDGQLLIDTAELTVDGVTQSIFIIINGANEDVRFEDANNARVSAADVPTDIEIGTTTALNGNFALGNIFMDLGISLEGQLATSSDPTVEFADSVSANLRGMFGLSASGDLEFTGTNAEALVLGVSTISLDLLVSAPEDTTEQIPLNLQVNIVNNDDDGRAEYEITGDVEANQTLTVSRVQGTEEDPDGVVGAVVFQWFRGDEGTPTLLSTGSTYSVTQADIDSGDTIGVFVRYTDGSGTTYTNTDGVDATTIVVFASPVKFATPTEAELMAPENDADWTLTVTATSEDSDSDGSDSDIASYDILEVLDASGADVTSDGIFSITDAGVISISAALDYEMSASYTLRIRATDTPEAESVVPGDTADTGTTTLTVNVQDVNEHAPAFVTNAEDSTLTDGTEEIAEDVANGHRVGLVRATDADGTNNVVTYTLDDGGAGVFGIRAVAGTDDWEIYVLDNTNLDFDGSTKSYALEITASDSDPDSAMSSLPLAVTVNLTDVNDNVPVVTPPPQSGVFRVRTTGTDDASGNAAAGTGYRITIDDADTNNDFTFNVSDPRFDFQAQGSADVTWELMLLAGQAVPEAEGGTITLTYHVNDGVANSVNVGQTTVTINVVDTPVEFATPDAADLMADENDADWTLTVMATSPGSNSDGSASDIASYEIVEVLDENDVVVASDGVFTIADRTIGKISISAGLDYETSASYTLVIQATDTVESMVPGDTADTNTARFTINLRDVNEHNPVFDTKADDPDLVANGDTVELAENAAAGTVVAQVRATDADGTSTVEYGITAGAGSNFVIDEETGVITVASGATFDYDGATKSYRLTVRAYDGPSTDPNASESDGQQITINLTDVNDNPPMVTADAGEIRTTTGNAADTPTGYSITVTDEDAEATNEFRVDADDPRFRFERDGTTNTWNLILLANQAVAAGTISLGYSATDGDNPPATGTITLMAVDTPVKFTAPAAADLIITENDSTNAWTVTITATSTGSDSDGSDSAISGYEILEVLDADGMTVDMNGVFSITDAGVISVSGALDHETSAYYTLRIEATDTAESGVSGDEADTGTTDLRVNVGDVNEADPVIEGSPTADAFVTTGATGGTEVTTVVVTDADTSQTFTYAITSGNTGDAFAIDDNGVITVASGTTLNRTTTATYDLEVTVTDNGVDASGTAATKSDTQNIKVTVREEVTTSIAEQVQGASVQSGTDGADVIDRSTQTGFEVIQGGDLSDTITVGSGGSVVFGGYGMDTITLGDGIDTVVHRFASIDGDVYRNDDGGDTIHGFERGKDKFIFVDTDGNAIDLASFIDETKTGTTEILGPDDTTPIADKTAGQVRITAHIDNDISPGYAFNGVRIVIQSAVKQDGPDGTNTESAGAWIDIFWDESYEFDATGLSDAENNQLYLELLGIVDPSDNDDPGAVNTDNDFTDYSVLPTHFNTDGSTSSFDVISLADLGVEII